MFLNKSGRNVAISKRQKIIKVVVNVTAIDKN